jgi:2-polyprenyl-3-methyl-5-hydroxy-6-metoxy-1,4-benzoquinol methylase
LTNADPGVVEAMPSPPCRACGEVAAPYLATRDYNRRVSEVEFRYSRCERCGLLSLVNAPADLAPYYAPDYQVLPRNDVDIERGVDHDRYKIDLVRSHVAGGRLLEIGASWGAFCLLAKRAGFAVEAIEMDPRCCDFLRTRIGVRVIQGGDEVAALGDATTPDVIAMWHVIEHVADPWRLLARAAERLAPGGVIVIATPNPAALQFKVLRNRWVHVDAPRHLHLLPAAMLRNRMHALGLREELCTTRDAGSLRWNAFGWSWSFAGLAGSRIMKRALRLAGRVVAGIAAPLEGREGLGSAYTAVYRKPVP